MKILSRVFALAALAALGLINTGCSKEEAAEPAAAATAAVEVETAEAATETAESSAPATETLEVVEESAAVAEPEDRAILLAQADANDTAAPARIWKYKEGEHYTRLIPTHGTVGGADKIEVAEVFMYSCPHCYTLEPYINQWAENKNPNVRLVRIPAIFNQLALMHAQLYYTEFYLAQAGKESSDLILNEPGLREYPPRTAANQPPTPYYERGRGVKYASYLKPTSENLGKQWYRKVEGSSIRIGNRASYAKWVHGDEQAAHMGKGARIPKGWKKLTDVAKDKFTTVKRIYQSWVNKAIKEQKL